MASYQDGSRIRRRVLAPPLPAPRPHPGRTVVTDHQPAGPRVAPGVGVALQDVDGVNFWGGRTYTRDGRRVRLAAGPRHIRTRPPRLRRRSRPDGQDPMATAAAQRTLSWNGPDGAPGPDRAAQLDVGRRRPLRLAPHARLCALPRRRPAGQPGQPRFQRPAPGRLRRVLLAPAGMRRRHGLDAGGGGPCRRRRAVARRSVQLHVARVAAGTFAASGAATLVFVAAEDSTDPWFVRVDGLPGCWPVAGLGCAGASLNPATPVRRSVTVFIADGILDTADIETLINAHWGTTHEPGHHRHPPAP